MTAEEPTATSSTTARGVHIALLVIFATPVLIVLLSALNGLLDHPAGLNAVVTFLTRCPRRHLLGEPCPLCGTTTAALLILKGELSASLHTNPLALALTPLILVQLGHRLTALLRRRSSLPLELASWILPAAWAVIALIALG